MTIDEQIANLKAIGLQIDNEDYARRILGDISYFRLINRIFAVLLCISHIVDHDGHWDKLLDDIEDLIAKYSNIDISSMGFPKNWKELLNPQDN
ncbi:MAG: hypothetical protein E7309_01870 [Butyrivibrio sp.]|jgi:abortive infection bacteriophage resistance protein|nr:hypothetical protein [Butyrivibrio sp.]